MSQAEIVRSLLIDVNGLITEAVNTGDRKQADHLMQRRDALLTHLGALDCQDNLRGRLIDGLQAMPRKQAPEPSEAQGDAAETAGASDCCLRAG